MAFIVLLAVIVNAKQEFPLMHERNNESHIDQFCPALGFILSHNYLQTAGKQNSNDYTEREMVLENSVACSKTIHGSVPLCSSLSSSSVDRLSFS